MGWDGLGWVGVGGSAARLGGSVRVASSVRKSGYRQRALVGHGVARGKKMLEGRRLSKCEETA